MQSSNMLLKILVLTSFILLMGSLVAYRSGSFDAALGRADYEQGDSTIPDSLFKHQIHSSKSMAPIFKPSKIDSPKLDSLIKPSLIIAPSSKSDDIFNAEDFAPSSKSAPVLDLNDIIAPSSKSGKVLSKKDIRRMKKKRKKQMMSGSKSAAVISPQ